MANNKEPTTKTNPTCGIIMPISLIDSCPPEHWNDVLGILKDVCKSNNFIPNLVSDADDIGIIHNRIIENIYSNDIIICDVSCKNANVMFELGMRLAFDKPTILIKDDQTGYSFDTSLIEHLEYPRDLRFTTILKFKENLAKKLIATYEKATSDPNFSTFLKNFGKYKIAHLEDKEISKDSYLIESIENLKESVSSIKNIFYNQSMIESDKLISLTDNNFTKNLHNKLISEKEKLIFNAMVKEKLHNIFPNEQWKNIDVNTLYELLMKDDFLLKLAGGSQKRLSRYLRDSL